MARGRRKPGDDERRRRVAENAKRQQDRLNDEQRAREENVRVDRALRDAARAHADAEKLRADADRVRAEADELIKRNEQRRDR